MLELGGVGCRLGEPTEGPSARSRFVRGTSFGKCCLRGLPTLTNAVCGKWPGTVENLVWMVGPGPVNAVPVAQRPQPLTRLMQPIRAGISASIIGLRRSAEARYQPISVLARR